MINWAIRYQPIVKELQHIQPPWVLDVGSGAEGIKLFWRGNVNGIDLHFKRRPLHRGTIASILDLPLADQSCPVVVCCDLLEHIQPDRREQMLSELTRVVKGHLLLGFPSGETAMQTYQSIANSYGRRRRPEWLREHLELGLPDAHQIEDWLNEAGWDTKIIWYESARLHKLLISLEIRFGGKFLTYSLMRLIGPEVISRLNFSDKEPKMRVLIKASRIDSPTHTQKP